jgi:hypothetical protein
MIVPLGAQRAPGSPQREAILCPVRQWPISVANESFSTPYLRLRSGTHPRTSDVPVILQARSAVFVMLPHDPCWLRFRGRGAWAFPSKRGEREPRRDRRKIGSSYGITAEQKLERPILYSFVPDDEGFRRIRDLATDALWPYSARDPAHATEAYLTVLNTLALGTIRFTATHYRTAEGGKSIVEMAFIAQIIAPEDFAFAADSPRTVPCPSKQ